MRDLENESEAVLVEQIAYYRIRAGEFDEWWEREGCHDRGPIVNKRWFSAPTYGRPLDLPTPSPNWPW